LGRKKEKEQAGGGGERHPERASEGRREGERKPMSETKRGREKREKRMPARKAAISTPSNGYSTMKDSFSSQESPFSYD